jgi:hypothetical protein
MRVHDHGARARKRGKSRIGERDRQNRNRQGQLTFYLRELPISERGQRLMPHQQPL